jgi:hypothetical protein
MTQAYERNYWSAPPQWREIGLGGGGMRFQAFRQVCRYFLLKLRSSRHVGKPVFGATQS